MNFSNELNLNFPFYKRQQRYQSHKWNIHSHIGRQNCHESAKRMSNKESPTTTSPHTGSIASDAHQNQQAARPSDTQCSQTVLSGRHTSQPIGKTPKQQSLLEREVCHVLARGLTRSWNFISLSRCLFLFHQGRLVSITRHRSFK